MPVDIYLMGILLHFRGLSSMKFAWKMKSLTSSWMISLFRCSQPGKGIGGRCRERGMQALHFSISSSSASLYGLSSQLKEPQHFRSLAAETIKKCDAIRKALIPPSTVGTHPLTPSEILFQMDRLSNEVCAVVDAAELCRHSHVDNGFRSEADSAFNSLSLYIQDLNQDDTLYYQLERITSDPILLKSLTEEERIFALDMKLEFERDGIHLNAERRKLCGKYHSDIIRYETMYIQNMGVGNEYFEVGPIRDAGYLGRVKPVLAQYTDQSKVSSPDYMLVTSNHSVSGALLRSTPDEEIRKQIYENSSKYPMDNQEILGNLIKSRFLLAKELGFNSHVEKYLKNKVMKSSKQVREMLKSTAVLVLPKVEEEVQILMNIKKKSQQTSGQETKLYPWDLYYLMDLDQSIQNSKRVNQRNIFAEISQYLTLSSCVRSLLDISNILFGITFKEQKLDVSERWDGDNDGILKYQAIGPNNEEIGYVFLDLFQRDNKFPNAAHFTVRCGCKTGSDDYIGSHQNIQTPIVALLFNFTPKNTDNKMESLITYSGLEVLYHEWGHALHSLLSRTTFQHLSGTRGSTDFVEVPSHLFEYFARDSRILSQWATHHTNKAPLPAHLIDEANSHKNRFAGIEILTQVLYSSIDQYAFSEDMGDLSQLSAMEVYQELNEGINKIQHDTLGAGNNFIPTNMLTHSHFTNYGGGYYSYLMARMYAAQIWEKRFQKDPMNRDEGMRLWNSFLRYGASKDPLSLLEQIGGGKLSPSFFLDNKL